MATAININPGLAWIPKFGNYGGNGDHDFSNKAYATAIAMAENSVSYNGQQVNVGEFLTHFDKAHEQAEAQVMSNYFALIGSNKALDSFHDMPDSSNPLDVAAFAHDAGRIAAGGDVTAEVNANLTFASSAVGAFFQTGDVFDLGAALFIGIGESGWDYLRAAGSEVLHSIENVVGDVAGYFENHQIGEGTAQQNQQNYALNEQVGEVEGDVGSTAGEGQETEGSGYFDLGGADSDDINSAVQFKSEHLQWPHTTPYIPLTAIHDHGANAFDYGSASSGAAYLDHPAQAYATEATIVG